MLLVERGEGADAVVELRGDVRRPRLLDDRGLVAHVAEPP